MEKLNCHGCKWLDRYKMDGNGYCCTVVRSKTQTSKIRRPDMERCELYEFGDWATRWAHLVTGAVRCSGITGQSEALKAAGVQYREETEE